MGKRLTPRSLTAVVTAAATDSAAFSTIRWSSAAVRTCAADGVVVDVAVTGVCGAPPHPNPHATAAASKTLRSLTLETELMKEPTVYVSRRVGTRRRSTIEADALAQMLRHPKFVDSFARMGFEGAGI